jgi:ATP-dependent 26S proteasome regulatory subunit
MDHTPNPAVMLMFADQSVPWMHRAMMLKELLENINPATEAMVLRVLELLANNNGEAVYREKNKKLDALLKEIHEGPMRVARFVELAHRNGNPCPQALVVLDDGTFAFAAVRDEADTKNLRLGDRVILDGKARLLLYGAPSNLKVGEEARLERKIDDQHLEVTIRGDERSVVLAPASLMSEITEGKVPSGSTLVLNLRQGMALGSLPKPDGFSHFQFLDKGPVPDVVVERDIGSPPKVIKEVANHIRQEMCAPEVRRRMRLRSCLMRILTGVSGSGKTLAVQAIHRQMYEIMSEVAGVGMDKLPCRVFRLRQSKLLSMWLGESDKNIDRLFDEIEQLAAEPYITPDGRKLRLPLLVVIEEVDGFARSRNSGADAIYDRLLTSLLQRLDPNREGLREKLVVFLATTNEPQIVDAAFLRRIGGKVSVFGRLKRSGFTSVLQKHVRGLPAFSNNGSTQEELWTQFTNDLVAWLYGPNSDTGVVELTYAGSTTPVVKCRRDFLTGALVDRAVQQAADEACEHAVENNCAPAIRLEQLMRALNDQVLAIVGQLREQNAGSYLDLPDGVRVASLRRLPQPSYLPIEFQRTSAH